MLPVVAHSPHRALVLTVARAVRARRFPLWLVYHFSARQAIRRMFGMPTPRGCEDGMTLCCCEGCAMCQELNELDLRAAAGHAPQPLGGYVVANPVPTVLVAPPQAYMAPAVAKAV